MLMTRTHDQKTTHSRILASAFSQSRQSVNVNSEKLNCVEKKGKLIDATGGVTKVLINRILTVFRILLYVSFELHCYFL